MHRYIFTEPRTTCVVITADLVAHKNAYKFDKISIEQTGFRASSLRGNHFTVYGMGQEFKF